MIKNEYNKIQTYKNAYFPKFKDNKIDTLGGRFYTVIIPIWFEKSLSSKIKPWHVKTYIHGYIHNG